MLGVGGSGETWLCIDNITKKQLAVKFIKRPIPQVVLPMLRYEIKASDPLMLHTRSPVTLLL